MDLREDRKKRDAATASAFSAVLCDGGLHRSRCPLLQSSADAGRTATDPFRRRRKILIRAWTGQAEGTGLQAQANEDQDKQEKAAMLIRAYAEKDLDQMLAIWNEVVGEGNAFPQEEPLDRETGKVFFASQSYAGVAESDGRLLGLYILHPNNIGRCGHICNASYAVSSAARGLHIGEKLVKDCMEKAGGLGFKILQFNAVVESNIHARHLYERLGFVQLGTIPGGFRMNDGHYENICPYYHAL